MFLEKGKKQNKQKTNKTRQDTIRNFKHLLRISFNERKIKDKKQGVVYVGDEGWGG